MHHHHQHLLLLLLFFYTSSRWRRYRRLSPLKLRVQSSPVAAEVALAHTPSADDWRRSAVVVVQHPPNNNGWIFKQDPAVSHFSSALCVRSETHTNKTFVLVLLLLPIYRPFDLDAQKGDCDDLLEKYLRILFRPPAVMKKNQGTARKIGFLLPENNSNDSDSGDKSVWPHPRQRKRAKKEVVGKKAKFQWPKENGEVGATMGGKLLDYTTNTKQINRQ